MTEFQEKRAEAEANGEQFFEISKPCRNGHNDLRYTSSGACVVCNRKANNERRKDKLAEYAKASKRRRHANKEKYREYIREYMIAYRKTAKGRANTKRAVQRYAERLKQQKEQTDD